MMKTRSAAKRLVEVCNDYQDQDGTGAERRDVKEISGMLGSQWSKEELQSFYEAYRKYEKDWKKVATALRNKSPDMVVALFNTNKEYLSLPDGVATAAGFIAMMTDHYNIMEANDIDQEGNDILKTTDKTQKHGKGKSRIGTLKGSNRSYPENLRKCPAPLEKDSFSLLVDDLLAGNKPRAIGKRTPRVPVEHYIRDGDRQVDILSPNNPILDCKVDASSASDAHRAELASADASQRKGSPQAFRKPSRKVEHLRSIPPQRGEKEATEVVITDENSIRMHNNCLRAVTANQLSCIDATVMDTSSAGLSETVLKVKKCEGESEEGTKSRYKVGYIRRAYGATKEVHNISYAAENVCKENTDGRTPSLQNSKEESAQLSFGGETFDALRSLAELASRIVTPISKVESYSGMQVEEQKQDVNSTCNPVMSGSTPLDHDVKSMTSVRRDNWHSKIFGVDATDRKGEKNASDKEQQTFLSEDSDKEQQTSLSEDTMQKRKSKSLLEKDYCATHSFRQCSTGCGNAPPLPSESADYFPSLTLSEDSGCRAVEVVESTRMKASALVDATVQAMFPLEEGEDASLKIGEGLKSLDNQHPESHSILPRSQNYPAYFGCGNSAYSACKCSYAFQSAATVHSLSQTVCTLSSANEFQIISKLISSCAATFLMIQACGEKKHPPAEMAQILESAVTALQPMSSQNQRIYKEIKTCMDMIKSQMLVLIPSTMPAFGAEVSIS